MQSDIPVEVGGAAYRIQRTSNVQYDAPQHPYAGGFIAEATRFAQAMHGVPVHLADPTPNAPTAVVRASGKKDVSAQPPPNVARRHVLNPAVDNGPAGETAAEPRGAIAGGAYQRARS